MSDSADQPQVDHEAAIRSRGYLPHWERQDALYFVTFRLADALPKPLLRQYEAERNAFLEKAPMLSPEEQERQERLFRARIQRYLDNGIGACSLRNTALAGILAETMRRFNGERYRLFAWCIMPNHVHVVFQPLGTHRLAEILHSWKSYTAHEANHLLSTKGQFWQREYYDHLIRSEEEFRRILEYIVGNPLKAGLEDWPWVEVLLEAP